MKKIIKIIVGVIIIGVLGYGIYYYLDDTEEVSVEKVSQAEIGQSVSEVGHVSADESITIYAPISGTIKKTKVKVNENVIKDELLAEYDVKKIEHDYNVAKLNSDSQKDNLETVQSDNILNNQKKNIADINEQELKSEYADKEKKKASIDAEQLKKDHKNFKKQSELEKDLDKLKNSLTLAQSKYETSVTLLNEANSTLSSAKSSLTAAEKKVSESNTRLTNLKNELTGYKKDSESYEKCQEKINAETTINNEVTTERNAIAAQIPQYEENVKKATEEKSKAEADLNKIIKKIEKKQKKLSKIPPSGLSSDDYKKSSEIQRELDELSRDITEQNTKKLNADEKIVTDKHIEQYQDSVDIANKEEEYAYSVLKKGQKGVLSKTKGIITEKLVSDGAYVEAGTPLFIIQPQKGYKVDVLISRYDIDKIEKGQKAEITIGNTIYDGKVKKIASVAEQDSNGKPRVKVTIKLDTDKVYPVIGLEADVKIITSETKKALGVSRNCIYTDDDGTYVYTLVDNEVKKKYVTIGLEGDSNVEIVKGLKEGETVIKTTLSDDDIGETYDIEE